MQLSTSEKRQAFSWWLRTGRLPTVRSAAGLELKFNPYHDPKDGRFTFGPGGAGSVAAYGEGQGPRMGRGGNSRAFEDPMTVEQAFPEINDPALKTFAAITGPLLDIVGPAAEAQIQVLDRHSKEVLSDIKRLDPNFVYQYMNSGHPSVEGSANRLDDLLMWQAATHARFLADYAPLRAQMIRRVQREVDKAYKEGLERLNKGTLKNRGVNNGMKLGNFIDVHVRENIRETLNQYGIKMSSNGMVRVNRREYVTSKGSYGLPDIRIADTYIEVSITRKTMADEQLRRFSETSPKPRYIVVVTPSGTHPNHTYVIKQ